MRSTTNSRFKLGASVLGLAGLLAVPALVLADSAYEDNMDYVDRPAFECPPNSSNDALAFTHPVTARIIRVCSSDYQEDLAARGATPHFCEDIAKGQKATKGHHHGVAFLVVTQVCVQGNATYSDAWGFEASATLDGVA